MYGFYNNTAVTLSASQSQATIFKGTNDYPNTTDGILWYRNPGVDNKKLAWNNANTALNITKPDGTDALQVYTSLNPVFIKLCDIDLYGARTKGISHKLFVHFDYTWTDREDWVPYMGIGGEIEFAPNPCDPCCNPCSTCCDPCGSCCNPCSSCCYPCSPCYSSCNSCDSSCCDPCCSTSCTTTCNPCCDSCCTCAVSQWGLWIKGGVAFD